MKDGQAAIRVFVDPDARLDVVMAVAILWNLQRPVAIAHGIVIADDAILVDAEESYVRKLVTELSGGVFGYLDSVLERHSFDEFGELI